MDPLVMQAMAKWPNVPHCYGWLALDARGNWRMRDEQAQAQNLPGDRIANDALLAFIQRNYDRDERGRWYFQNGPQRVYVTLEFTPFVARTNPDQGFVLHTGAPLSEIDAAFMTPAGELVLAHRGIPAVVDDRDMAQCLPMLRIDGAPASDDAVMAWLTKSEASQHIGVTLQVAGKAVPVERIDRNDVPKRFGFERSPTGDS